MMLTRCPYCGTTFRVTPDQLKVRQGQVRCGKCRRVFDALRGLVEEQPRAAQVTAPEPKPAADAGLTWTIVQPAPPGVETPPAAEPVIVSGFDTLPADEPRLAPAVDDNAPIGFEPLAGDSLAEPPAPLFPAEVLAEPALPEEGLAAPVEEITIEAPPGPALDGEGMDGADERGPPTEPGTEPEAETEPEMNLAQPDIWIEPELEPEPEAKLKPRFDPLLAEIGPPTVLDLHEPLPSPAPRWPWVLGSLVAVLVLAAQLALHYRTELIASSPDSRPLFAAACELLGCRIELPHRIELIGIDSSDLSPDEKKPGTLYLTSTLRNRASFAQAWPHLEVTLTDAQERPLLRRALEPAEYLPETVARDQGFPARSEQLVQLTLAAPDVPAVGYRLYIFHP